MQQHQNTTKTQKHILLLSSLVLMEIVFPTYQRSLWMGIFSQQILILQNLHNKT